MRRCRAACRYLKSQIGMMVEHVEEVAAGVVGAEVVVAAEVLDAEVVAIQGTREDLTT